MNTRAFTGCALAFCGTVLPFTGVANHVLDAGGLTLQRHAWMAAHNLIGLLFVIFAIWHVVLNRKALGAHIRAVKGKTLLKREAVYALAVVGLALLLAVGHAFHAG